MPETPRAQHKATTTAKLRIANRRAVGKKPVDFCGNSSAKACCCYPHPSWPDSLRTRRLHHVPNGSKHRTSHRPQPLQPPHTNSSKYTTTPRHTPRQIIRTKTFALAWPSSVVALRLSVRKSIRSISKNCRCFQYAFTIEIQKPMDNTMCGKNHQTAALHGDERHHHKFIRCVGIGTANSRGVRSDIHHRRSRHTLRPSRFTVPAAQQQQPTITSTSQLSTSTPTYYGPLGPILARSSCFIAIRPMKSRPCSNPAWTKTLTSRCWTNMRHCIESGASKTRADSCSAAENAG